MGRRGWRGFKYHANEKEAGNHQGPLGMEEEGIDSQNSQRYVVTEDEQEEEEEKKKKKKKTHVCIFFVASILAPQPTQPPVQWRPAALPSGKKESGRCVTSIDLYVFRGMCLFKQRDDCNRLTH